MYTYFIVTPGTQVNAYIRYPNDGRKYNFIKYGDSDNLNGAIAIRQQYLTHNPDIGVGAVFTSTAFTNPNLGTRLKHHITQAGFPAVGTTEWIVLDDERAWDLFDEMQRIDGQVLTPGDWGRLILIINDALRV